MSESGKKILVHFNTNDVNIYELNNKSINLLKHEQVFFNETLVNNELLNKIDKVLTNLELLGITVNNEKTRLYATGIFQNFSQEEQEQLVIDVFVSHGLYFNVIPPDLEVFYLETSYEKLGKKNVVAGLALQEFRRVVICGSFQQNMNDIGKIIDVLHKYNIQVMSPWTMNIVPETVGTDFILLEGQELINERDSWRHKYDHMNKFKTADAVIVCNPNGTIGKGTMFEFGFMVACSKRIIFTNNPNNLSILFPYEVGLNFS